MGLFKKQCTKVNRFIKGIMIGGFVPSSETTVLPDGAINNVRNAVDDCSRHLSECQKELDASTQAWEDIFIMYKTMHRNELAVLTEEDDIYFKSKVKSALEHAEKADSLTVEYTNPEYGKRFIEQYVGGMRILVNGFETNDAQNYQRGTFLIDQFFSWLRASYGSGRLNRDESI
jgi:hypothetical protein